jgi:hypothetical protein
MSLAKIAREKLSIGTIGLLFALGSLVPLEIWLILIARRLFQLGQGGSLEEAKQPALA